MPILTSDQLKGKFSDKKRPNGDDFADLIDTCINTGYTGNVTIGNSMFTITNGIITDISLPGDENSTPTTESSLPVASAQSVTYSEPVESGDSIVLISGTGYDGTYIHEDKIFPDPDILKVYVNSSTRNRFISYKAQDGKIYWEIVKRGWFGTISSLKSNPGISSGLKSQSFELFTDLPALKGNWREFFGDSSNVVASIRNVWAIN